MALLSPAPLAPRWGLILPGMNSVTESDLLYICKGAPGWHPHCLIYTTWHTSLQKNPHPASGSLSTPCPVSFVHAACTEGHSAHSFEAWNAALWGGRARLQTSWQVSKLAHDAGVLKQTHSAVYLLLTPAWRFCKSSISQVFKPQFWTYMQWPGSCRARNVPEAWEILSTQPPCSLLHGTQFVPRGASQGRQLLVSHYLCGRFEKSVGFPPLTEAQQLQGQLDFHVKRIRGKRLFLFTLRL